MPTLELPKTKQNRNNGHPREGTSNDQVKKKKGLFLLREERKKEKERKKGRMEGRKEGRKEERRKERKKVRKKKENILPVKESCSPGSFPSIFKFKPFCK